MESAFGEANSLALEPDPAPHLPGGGLTSLCDDSLVCSRAVTRVLWLTSDRHANHRSGKKWVGASEGAVG